MARIRGGQIKHGTVTGLHIEDKSIEGVDVADRTLEGAHLKLNTVEHENLDINWKESVADEESLPSSDNSIGDVRIALAEASLNIWNGLEWSSFATSSYSTSNFNTDFATKTTDDLDQGEVNKYFFNHDNTNHSETYITSSGVTFSNLDANSGVGTGSNQVAVGDHNHNSVYYTQTYLDSLINQDVRSTASPQFNVITSTGLDTDNINVTSVHPTDTATIFGSESEGNSTLHVRIGNDPEDKIQFESWNGSSSSSLLEIGQTDVTILGNLNVTGTTTTIDSTTINVSDNEIILNSGVTGSPILNASITVNRGTSTDSKLLWNETDDKWQIDNGTGTPSNILSQVLGDERYYTQTQINDLYEFEWSHLKTYNENYIVSYNGDFYRSLQDNNLDKQPDTEEDWWEEYFRREQYGFLGTLTEHHQTNNRMYFDNVHYNIGNMYDPSTAIVTIPRTGWFYISYGGISQTQALGRMRMRVDYGTGWENFGGDQTILQARDGESDFTHASVAAPFYFEEGVLLEMNPPSHGSWYARYTWWGVVEISPAKGDKGPKGDDGPAGPAEFEWKDDQTYNENYIVSYNGNLYLSLQDHNLDKQPDTETDWWEMYLGGVEDWHYVGEPGEPAFENGWGNTQNVSTFPHRRCSFKKLPNGLVILRGEVGGGTIQENVFTLPPEYRSAGRVSATSGGYGITSYKWFVDVHGGVQPHGWINDSGAGYYLNGIIFLSDHPDVSVMKGEKGDPGTTTADGTNGDFNVPGTLKIGGGVTLEYNSSTNSLEFIFDE